MIFRLALRLVQVLQVFHDGLDLSLMSEKGVPYDTAHLLAYLAWFIHKLPSHVKVVEYKPARIDARIL